jgi:hypothetical protein
MALHTALHACGRLGDSAFTLLGYGGAAYCMAPPALLPEAQRLKQCHWQGDHRGPAALPEVWVC